MPYIISIYLKYYKYMSRTSPIGKISQVPNAFVLRGTPETIFSIGDFALLRWYQVSTTQSFSAQNYVLLTFMYLRTKIQYAMQQQTPHLNTGAEHRLALSYIKKSIGIDSLKRTSRVFNLQSLRSLFHMNCSSRIRNHIYRASQECEFRAPWSGREHELLAYCTDPCAWTDVQRWSVATLTTIFRHLIDVHWVCSVMCANITRSYDDMNVGQGSNVFVDLMRMHYENGAHICIRLFTTLCNPHGINNNMTFYSSKGFLQHAKVAIESAFSRQYEWGFDAIMRPSVPGSPLVDALMSTYSMVSAMVHQLVDLYPAHFREACRFLARLFPPDDKLSGVTVSPELKYGAFLRPLFLKLRKSKGSLHNAHPDLDKMQNLYLVLVIDLCFKATFWHDYTGDTIKLVQMARCVPDSISFELITKFIHRSGQPKYLRPHSLRHVREHRDAVKLMQRYERLFAERLTLGDHGIVWDEVEASPSL